METVILSTRVDIDCSCRRVYIWTIYEIFNQTRECKNKISRIKIEI